MVRTRSDCSGVRVSAKAPRKTPSSTSSTNAAGKSSKRYDGGNSVCPRETPAWQKEITNFFSVKQINSDDADGAISNNCAQFGGSTSGNTTQG